MNRVIPVLALVLAVAAALPARADDPPAACPATVPASLVPAANQRLRFVRPATGVQIYMCTLNAAGAGAWSFVAPQANLYNDDGALAATHFIGPVWQANDGSSVTAAKVAGATVDATAIPWLLLKSVSNVAPGHFANITTVQRLNTVGGLAPAASTCGAANVGAVVGVPYSADYFLYDTHEPRGSGENAQCR